jgi:hypothetical protein
MASQPDRIERRVSDIAKAPRKLTAPPPVPPKDVVLGDDQRLVEDRPNSPALSEGSDSSAETARPVTPSAIPDAVAQQFDDMRQLLGTLIGRTDDILHETAKRQAFEIEMSPKGPSLGRIEDLLRRLLFRAGDTELTGEYEKGANGYIPPLRRFEDGMDEPETPSEEWEPEASMYRGGDSVSTAGPGRRRAPPPSHTSSFIRAQDRNSLTSDSHNTDRTETPGFDDEFAIKNLPPDIPPRGHIEIRSQAPPNIVKRKGGPQQQSVQPGQEYYIPGPARTEEYAPESEYGEQYQDQYQEPSEGSWDGGEEPEKQQDQGQLMEDDHPLPPTPSDIHPIPIPAPGSQSPYKRQPSLYSADDGGHRLPVRTPPTPQPIGLPSPVNSEDQRRGGYGYPSGQPGMRPGVSGGPGMPGMPMPPGMMDMPRMSMPRIAGVRDPISTT